MLPCEPTCRYGPNRSGLGSLDLNFLSILSHDSIRADFQSTRRCSTLMEVVMLPFETITETHFALLIKHTVFSHVRMEEIKVNSPHCFTGVQV